MTLYYACSHDYFLRVGSVCLAADWVSCLTQVPSRPTTHVTRQILASLSFVGPFLQTLALSGGTGLIAWRLKQPALREYQWGSRLFWNCLARVGSVPYAWTHLEKYQYGLVLLVGRTTNTPGSRSFLELGFRTWYDIALRLLARFLSPYWPCLLGRCVGTHFRWPSSLVHRLGRVCLGLLEQSPGPILKRHCAIIARLVGCTTNTSRRLGSGPGGG